MLQPDTTWLDLGGRLQKPILQEHLRAYMILEQLPQPETQRPQMLAFLGDKHKRLLLKTLFSIDSAPHHKVLLHRIPDRTHTSPVLIANCELHGSRILTNTVSNIVQKHPLKWQQDAPNFDAKSLANLVYTQLLLPFSTVFCIFADDFQGMEEVALILSKWLKLIHKRAYPSTTFTRILVLVNWDDRIVFDERLAATELIKQLRRQIKLERGQELGTDVTDAEFERFLKDRYFEIRMLPVAISSTYNNEIRQATLRNRIIHESSEIHNLRAAAKISFSARHFINLFKYACRHFSQDIIHPFDFIQATRITNEVPIEFGSKVLEFTKIVPTENKAVVAPVIASALYLDNFPPGAHIFNLKAVFDTLYSKMLADVISTDLFTEVQNEFCRERDCLNTALHHRQTLQGFSTFWENHHSASVCFSCLARAPEFFLDCKHSICETCLTIYGKTTLDDVSTIFLRACPICAAPTQTEVHIKPKTAGVRGLVLDGGTKFHFTFLNRIQDVLALPISISDHFDIVTASGSGGFEAIERFCTPTQTLTDTINLRKITQALCENVPGSRFSGSSGRSSALRILPRWEALHSSMTAITTVNTLPFQALYQNKTLFNAAKDQKIGIIVDKLKDSRMKIRRSEEAKKRKENITKNNNNETCLLSNYNNSRPLLHGKNKKARPTMLLSECARISLLQKPIHGFQAKRLHDPEIIISTVISEQEMIWKRNRTIEVLIAVGEPVPEYYQRTSPRNICPGLVDYRNQHTKEELKLDIQRSADLLLASLFYLELIGLPQPNEEGTFSSKIQIRCRFAPSSLEYPALVERLRMSRARFLFDYQSICCVNNQLFGESLRGIAFSRCLEVRTETLDVAIDVRIGVIIETPRSISNCPYTLTQLMKDQRLDCVFGNKDHGERYFGSHMAFI